METKISIPRGRGYLNIVAFFLPVMGNRSKEVNEGWRCIVDIFVAAADLLR